METKKWWESKAVWGGIVAVLAGAAGLFGVSLGVEDQAYVIDAITAIASAVGGLLAVYGRVKADTKVGK